MAVEGDAEASPIQPLRLAASCNRRWLGKCALHILANGHQPLFLAVTATSFREQSIAERFLMKAEDNVGILEIGLALLPLEL